MTAYVLVHGAWGGGWAWEGIASRLRERGHRVIVPALKGLGSRRDELHPGITLSDHIDDVCQQIAAAGFDRFVLAGHSWGGMVITGVAARLGGQIDAIAYFDAFLPADGQSLWDITGGYEHRHYIDSQKHTPGLVAPIIGQLGEKLGRHPLLTLTEAVRLTGNEDKIGKRIYVFATGWQPTPFGRFADAVKEDKAWSYHEAATSHDVMGEAPDLTLDLLLSCA